MGSYFKYLIIGVIFVDSNINHLELLFLCPMPVLWSLLLVALQILPFLLQEARGELRTNAIWHAEAMGGQGGFRVWGFRGVGSTCGPKGLPFWGT